MSSEDGQGEVGMVLSGRAQGYANAHRQFLQENNPRMLNSLRESGELSAHLRQIGEDAESMHESLSTQMQNSPDLPTDYLVD